MLQNIFKQYLKEEVGSKRQINNLRRANQSLLIRLAKCINTLVENQAGVDYYVPIYGSSFNLDNKVRFKTLNILKEQKLIEVKTNSQGRESYQCSFTNNRKRNDINNPTPKRYRFTEYGWSLIQQQQFMDEIKQLSSNRKKQSKYQTPEEFNSILRKAAEDNLSLVFKPNKPLPVVVKQYLDAVKDEWHVTDLNYSYKLKEAEKVVMTTIHNFNNKLLKFNQRMYTALSLCPKELRQYIITRDGEHIGEGFDINSSIYTLLGDTIELYLTVKQIPIPAEFYQQKKQLLKLCFNPQKHIYAYIGQWNGKHYTKEQIKPHNMEVIFSNNEDIKKRDQKNGPRNQIKDFFANHFPTMWEILTHFEEEQNQNYEQELEQYNQFIEDISLYNAGLINHKPRHINQPKKVKSTIWRYFHQVETYYELKLKQQLEAEDSSITAYWIHDCLSFKQSLLTAQFKAHIQNTFKSLLGINSFNQLVSISSQQLLEQIQNYLLLFGGGVVEDRRKRDSILYGGCVRIEKSEYEQIMEEINNKIGD